jgi:protein arginine N-methyltransferase 1
MYEGPEGGYTHWGQQVFYLKDGIDCTTDTHIKGTVTMPRQDKNKRLYNMDVVVQVDDREPQQFKYEIP